MTGEQSELAAEYARRSQPLPLPQRQDSLTDQLNDLYRLAVAHGLYDAADAVARILGRR